MFGFVTSSPLFDSPARGRELTHEEEIRLRQSAQRAMEAGRPLTIAEMYGKPQQLFTTLNGLGITLPRIRPRLRAPRPQPQLRSQPDVVYYQQPETQQQPARVMLQRESNNKYLMPLLAAAIVIALVK